MARVTASNAQIAVAEVALPICRRIQRNGVLLLGVPPALLVPSFDLTFHKGFFSG